MEFEDKLISDIKTRIIHEIAKTDFIKIDYGQKKTLPNEFLNKAWASVDWDTVLLQVKENMETRICNAIIGNMDTEIKTDIKSLLSVDGVRQKLRIEVYPHLMKVLNEKLD